MLENQETLVVIKCINEAITTNGTVLFIKGNTYTATVSGSFLLVKDETGCIRTIATSKEHEWNKDKQFKEYFKVEE
jgi:hypothetical protein